MPNTRKVLIPVRTRTALFAEVLALLTALMPAIVRAEEVTEPVEGETPGDTDSADTENAERAPPVSGDTEAAPAEMGDEDAGEPAEAPAPDAVAAEGAVAEAPDATATPSEVTDTEAGDMMGASLEELLATPIEVWTATKTVENIEEAPSIIEVVTAEDMERWGYHSVAEVLQQMLGFYVIDNHILPNASVRGVSGGLGSESGLIKVMINGRSVAFRATASNWLGPELIPLSAIDRIEVIRGPASALYGADAFLATVNVVLKKPEQINGVRLHGILGSELESIGAIDSFADFDSQYDLATGTKLGDFGLMLSFAGEKGHRDGLLLPESSPSPTVPAYNADTTSALPLPHESHVWYGQVSYDRERGSLALSAYGSAIDRGGDFSQWSQLSNGRDAVGRMNGTRIQLQHYVIGLDGTLHAAEKLDFTLNLTFFTGTTMNGDRIEVASDLYYIRRKFSYRGINPVFESVWRPIDKVTLVGGFELVFDDEQLPENERIDKSTGDLLSVGSSDTKNDRKQFFNPGIYLQGNWTAVPRFLSLTGGLRYDYHNIYGNQVTGRAGMVFLWNKYLSTKLLYGSAFKAPSPGLLYSVPMAPGDVVGNEDLRPQYVHTFELAPTLHVNRYLSFRSTVAYNIVKDIAEFMPRGINIAAENVSKLHAVSWENAVDLKYKDIVTSFMSFEWQYILRQLGQEGYVADLVGKSNIVCPPWIFRVGASSKLPFFKPVPTRIGVQAMVVAKRRASGENIVDNGGSYYLPAYTMIGASLSFPDIEIFPTGKTTFSIRAYNLLDVRGPDPGFAGVDYPLQSRRAMAEMVQTF